MANSSPEHDARSLKITAPPKPTSDKKEEAKLPRRFGRLTLLKPIARGGMGEVFLATTGGIEGAERPCVVKIIRREHVTDSSFLARFLDEARIQAQLDHPGVARILEAETDPTGKPYVVVEYVEGRNLAEVRNRGSQLNAPIQWADAVAVAVSLSEALCYVHERTDHEGRPLEIVHRDLSPQNVMVSYGGDVKLIDFGTARGENRRCHTVSGVVLAKPGYVAPEVANDTPGGIAADLYALGIILWELCAGRRFLTGDPQAHVRAVASGRKSPTPIAALIKAPAELDTVVARLTAPRVEDRYASARDVMADLVRLLKKASSLANGERSVRARVAHLMERLYPAEPMRSRAELACLIGVARDHEGARKHAVAPSPSPPPAGEDDSLFPGTRYRIVRELGRGAMGVVYEAQHVDIGRRVALKVLPKERCGSADLEERFRREARAIARLKHDHLVLLHDFGIASDGRPFYAMELCEGETLERRLETRHALPWQEVFRLALDACSALSAAHAAGLVHRDIKPGNLFVTRDGTVKVLDFGIVQTKDEVNRQDQETALRLTGTVEYMAPEQAAGESVDERADLYALGAVLYECLTGTRPHTADSLVALVDMKLGEKPEAPSRRAPLQRIPRHVDRVILRSLDRKPEGRFESADDMRLALGRALALPLRKRTRRRQIAAGSMALAAGVLSAVALIKSEDPAVQARAHALIAPAAERIGVWADPAPVIEDEPVAVLHELPGDRGEGGADTSAAAETAPEADPSPGATLAPATTDADDEAPTEDATEESSGPGEPTEDLPALEEPVRSALAAIERYSSQGRHIKALSAARRLAKKHPDDPRILAVWSDTAIATKGWGEALRAAIKWASVDSSVDAQLHLARVQKSVGQRYGAVATIERLLDRDPDNERALELLGEYSPNRLALR